MSFLDRFRPRKSEREIFDLQCLKALRKVFPAAKVDLEQDSQIRVDLPGREGQTIFTDNAWQIWRSENDQSTREKEFSRWIQGVASFETALLSPISKEAIVPQVKDELYFSQITERFGKPPDVVREHLVADLWIVYAIDSPKAITTMKPDQLREVGVQQNELRELAKANLKRILPPVERHGDGSSYFMLTAGGDYVASLLLYEEIWDQQNEDVDGSIIAVVPSRDVILFTGSGNQHGLEEMRNSVKRIHETGAYLVSDTLLKRTGLDWTPFIQA
jgi:uncharacterized protein YtpQ (UPF0354 family)